MGKFVMKDGRSLIYGAIHEFFWTHTFSKFTLVLFKSLCIPLSFSSLLILIFNFALRIFLTLDSSFSCLGLHINP